MFTRVLFYNCIQFDDDEEEEDEETKNDLIIYQLSCKRGVICVRLSNVKLLL